MLGRELPLVYETTEIEAPLRVTAARRDADGVSIDTMTFDLKPGGGTTVTYDADVTPQGSRCAPSSCRSGSPSGGSATAPATAFAGRLSEPRSSRGRVRAGSPSSAAASPACSRPPSCSGPATT